tara:strand:+ start:644 stop:1120 length:477 start_codon:yes stop_codon:yes gene_type:complete
MKPLLLLDGVFGQDADGLYVLSTDEGRQNVAELLGGWLEATVTAHLHHFPPQPVDKSLPGGGSCLWNGHCPHGHRERPGWLLHQDLQGTVESPDGEYKWYVGGHRLLLDQMVGHYGRLIILDDDLIKAPDPNASQDELLREAEQLTSLLEALRGIVNE